MQIDLKTLPFSRRESSMAISWRPRIPQQPEGLYLRALHGSPKWGEVCRISLRSGGAEIPFKIEASAERMVLTTKAGQAEFIFAEPSLIHFRASGVSLRLESKTGMFDNAQPLAPLVWMVSSFSASTKFLFSVRSGQLKVSAPWDQLSCRRIVIDYGGDKSGRLEGTIREIADHVPVRSEDKSFAASQRDVRQEWNAWRTKVRNRSRHHVKAIDLAAYVNWSAIVPASGFLKRPAMLMSKNIMSNIWSWDHCFNAMAHCQSHPTLGWDQFMIFFDQQSPSGAIPDRMGDTVIVWNFTKPPVHGWALGWMLARGLKLSDAQALAAYQGLAALTEWWIRCRDYDGDGRPEYYHGNDCGWDNATVFKNGGPVESPDLFAFLILQMEILAVLARDLLKIDEAKSWQNRAENLLGRLISEFWRDGQFIAYGPGNVEIPNRKTLFLHLPLVLGKRLPAEIRKQMVKNLLASGLITRHGLATEAPDSPLYENDGYWRGPIWAPPTLLIVDGLWDMGEKKLAASIAEKFCRLCAKSGFAENFDARSGAGLRDRSYTWTASVFLILAKNYLTGTTSNLGKSALR